MFGLPSFLVFLPFLIVPLENFKFILPSANGRVLVLVPLQLIQGQFEGCNLCSNAKNRHEVWVLCPQGQRFKKYQDIFC